MEILIFLIIEVEFSFYRTNLITNQIKAIKISNYKYSNYYFHLKCSLYPYPSAPIR